MVHDFEREEFMRALNDRSDFWEGFTGYRPSGVEIYGRRFPNTRLGHIRAWRYYQRTRPESESTWSNETNESHKPS